MSEISIAPAEQPAIDQRLFAWLTVERFLYGILFVAAGAIRLAALGQWPLDELGANTALAAWRTIQGSSWRPAAYSPLLYDFNLALFYFTRATDATPRLLPAIGGAFLALTPYGLRGFLGRRGALATATLLTLAPTWVHFSRRADGVIWSALATMLLLVAASRYLHTHDKRAWRLGAITLGIGLTAGPEIYTPLLAWAVGGGLAWLLRRRVPLAWLTLKEAGSGLRREHGWLLGGTFLAIASAFTFNPSGIGASANLLEQWGNALISGIGQWPWSHALRNLAVYEGLAVALAIVGMIRAFRARTGADIGLLTWLGAALLLNVALGHRASNWLPGLLLPLALLAGRGVEWAWERLFARLGRQDLAVWAILTTPLAFAYLELANYMFAGQGIVLWFAAGAIALVMLAWVGYWLWTQREGALTVGVLLLLPALLIPMIRASTALAYQTGLDPREPILDGQAPSAEWQKAESFLMRYSARRAGDPHLIEVVYEGALDPWAAWHLRRYPNARAVPSVATSSAAVLIAPAGLGDQSLEGYVGQRFRWREWWEPQPVSVQDRWRWLLMRDRVGSLTADHFDVWVRTPD